MTETTRRAVVLGAGGAGLAVALSACAGYSTGGGSTAAAPTEDAADKAPPADAAGKESGGAGKGSDGAEKKSDGAEKDSDGAEKTAGDAPAAAGIARTSDIPQGGGKILENEKIVITQPSAGQFKAFSAVCTHAGCAVGSVSNGTIICPCHGSKFSAKDGSVTEGPASQPLAEKKISVQGGNIVLA